MCDFVGLCQMLSCHCIGQVTFERHSGRGSVMSNTL